MLKIDEQRTIKPVKKKRESISAAESLADHKPAPGLASPPFQVESARSKDQGKSAQSETQEKKGPYKTGGSITIYCNGFLIENDLAGNEERENRAGNDASEKEVMHDDYGTIKGQEDGGYWGGVEKKMEQRFAGQDANENFQVNADSTFYFNGSDGPWTSAPDRQKFGENAALTMIAKVENGEFELNEKGELPDAINIVGHSMGGAYAAGLATQLLKYNKDQGKEVFKIKSVYYMAPHQPMDIVHPSEIRGVQYSHPRDTVSSDAGAEGLLAGKGIIPLFTGSRMGPINGIHEYTVYDDEKWSQDLAGANSDRGGHNAPLHDYIFDRYDKGIDGHVASNSDSTYDKGTYEHKVRNPTAAEKKGAYSVPHILDDLEKLPNVLRGKVDGMQQWVSGTLDKGRGYIDEGRQKIDDLRERGEDWAHGKVDDLGGSVDDMIDKGDGMIDAGLEDLVNKADEIHPALGGVAGYFSGLFKGKKDEGVGKVRDAKSRVSTAAHDGISKASDTIGKKTDQLHKWVTSKTDKLTSYINNKVAGIASWAKDNITKYENKAHILAKKIQRKIRSLIKKVMSKIAQIKKKVGKYDVVIKELRQWD